MKKYNVSDFELVKFYSYTSTIPYNAAIIEVSKFGWQETAYKNIIDAFETFYHELIQEAIRLDGRKCAWAIYDDNKTVFLIRRKSDGKQFFIGRYDWRYAIGTEVMQYFGHQYNFETRTFIDDIENKREHV